MQICKCADIRINNTKHLSLLNREQNVQVSDTTGDATEIKSLQPKKSTYLVPGFFGIIAFGLSLPSGNFSFFVVSGNWLSGFISSCLAGGNTSSP